MNITILNGNPGRTYPGYDSYLVNLSASLEKRGHCNTIISLHEKHINTCKGCYTCFLKTPGICTFRDDMPEIIKLYLKSDFVLFVTPVIMGFISTTLKRVKERLLTTVLPYLQVNGDRTLHIPRYSKKPPVGVLLRLPDESKSHYIPIIHNIFTSCLQDQVLFTRTMNMNFEEVTNEIISA